MSKSIRKKKHIIRHQSGDWRSRERPSVYSISDTSGMTMKWFGVLAVITILPALAWSSDVKTDFDPAVDFTKFKSFAFIGGHELDKSGVLANPENRERIKNFIGGVMENRGLHEVPRDTKYDLAVRYWVAKKQKADQQVVYSSDPMIWGGYPTYWTGVWGGYYTEYVVHNYVEGTLVVDLLNPATKELVWRTYLRQKIEDRSEAYVEAKKNLNKSFALFPPDADAKEQMAKDRAKLAKKYAKEIGE